MIHVAHLLDGRHFGGAEQMVRRLAAASPRIGVVASVYCLSSGRLSAFLEEEKIRVRVFPSSGRFDFRPAAGMANALREDRVQIIQAHTSRTHLMARLLSQRTGIPNITTIHSPIALDENVSTRRHPIRAMAERSSRRWTDRICPVSLEEANRLVKEESVDQNKIAWIPNGLNAIEPLPNEAARRSELAKWLAERKIATDSFVIAMIAMMRPRKGPEVLLRAFAGFIGEGGRGVLLLIGDDEFAGKDYLPKLRSLARELGIEGHVRFLGFQRDPWQLAEGADLVVLPSLFGEGLPLVLLEAMNRAIPIAASDILGNRECVIDGENGWLHSPGAHQELAGQLVRASKDRARLRAMGNRGRELFLEKFEMGKVLQKWEGVYRSLAEADAITQRAGETPALPG